MTEFEKMSRGSTGELIGIFKKNAEAGAEAVPPVRCRLRLPLVLVAPDEDEGKVLLHDLRTSNAPSPNACLTLPVVKRDGVFPELTLATLVKRHMRERMFRQNESAGLGGACIQPLGVYKFYAADTRDVTVNVTSIPVLAQPKHPSDDYVLKRNFNYYRGTGIWVPLAIAASTLQEQAAAMPENRLAAETATIFSIYLQRHGIGAQDGAHPRTI